ncbi:hypothetical protein F2Q69_00062332 [Brassica cretica]|uniref:Uncharacterized protein n=1 Tax=Brassica cretica TaxID=69181 RepID=A0A8S9RDM7_BRACR|nr:hypothetical protein F2Q69_00062332 [Brassica cretica]
MSSQPDTISPLDHRRLKSGKEGPSVAPRAPASLRLQEPSAHSGEVRITIPPSQNKAEGKRRVTKDRNTTSGYERHRRQSPRDHPPSQTDKRRRELCSGKLVSNSKSLASNGLMVDPLGANTSIDAGSHNSRTPPSRQLRERLEFPQELSSERTLTTSRERSLSLTSEILCL